jgi:ADP-ribose pyrophosphatase YjhB (NUDIX family)
VTEAILVRPTARVLLLDDAGRVLLLRIHDPSVTRGPHPIPADFWLLPGGGLADGETWQDAARRELFEETGIHDVTIGRCVRAHEKVVANASGGLWRVVERIHVGRVSGTPQVGFGGHEPQERSTIVGYRWFTRDEIVARGPHETFRPPDLADLVAAALTGAA